MPDAVAVLMGIQRGNFVEVRGRPWLVEAIDDSEPDLTLRLYPASHAPGGAD
jgi:hypothetical protein